MVLLRILTVKVSEVDSGWLSQCRMPLLGSVIYKLLNQCLSDLLKYSLCSFEVIYYFKLVLNVSNMQKHISSKNQSEAALKYFTCENTDRKLVNMVYSRFVLITVLFLSLYCKYIFMSQLESRSKMLLQTNAVKMKFNFFFTIITFVL